MKRNILFLLLVIIHGSSYAVGEANNFTVKNVRVDKSGYGFIKFHQALQGTPATCISNHDYHLSFDTNTPGGRGVLSLALTAQTTGNKIYARGTGACDQLSVVESWQYGWIIGP